ncbi:DDB1- and CUL4-associated factor 11 isoform X2 [Cylas formicarius]|uniref:DDB1- and CUL4-associated factor 11 isoform X2 n=1 Tax=Cylas formicarius TaxID=197179 RepID=UPI0029584882|nr:DDB1- and CUL4-associated factor 11 isoform X2 [Cylas formicarius]
MGALNSRRMIMMIDDDEDSSSRIEDTSDELGTDSDSESNTNNFVEMLHNLISSGQLLLQGGDAEYLPTRPMPKIKYQLDTSLLDKSEFSLLTKQACALVDSKGSLSTGTNVAAMIAKRQSGLFSHGSFSSGSMCNIRNQYLPNEMVWVLEGSTGKVFCGIFTKDGNSFLTASQDRYIRLYNSENTSYKMYKRIRARDVGWSIIDVAFSPDSESFVYSTWSSSLHICPTYGSSENQDPVQLSNTSRRFCVFSVVFSSDSRELLCGANDGCLYVYDRVRNARKLKITAHEYDVNRVLFADNSSQIIYSGGDDGLVKVWDRRTMDESRNVKPVGVLAGHMDGITYIDSRGDGRHLISNSKDQSIKLWDVRRFSDDKAAKETLKAAHSQTWDYRWQGVPKELYADNKLSGDTSIMTYRGHVVVKTLVRCRFSPKETTGQRYIYTGCGSGRIVIYDALTGKIIKHKKNHMACVRDVSWHPTRNEILSSSWDGIVGKWEYFRPNSSDDDQAENKKLLKRRAVRRSPRLAARRRRREESRSTSDN